MYAASYIINTEQMSATKLRKYIREEPKDLKEHQTEYPFRYQTAKVWHWETTVRILTFRLSIGAYQELESKSLLTLSKKEQKKLYRDTNIFLIYLWQAHVT